MQSRSQARLLELWLQRQPPFPLHKPSTVQRHLPQPQLPLWHFHLHQPPHHHSVHDGNRTRFSHTTSPVQLRHWLRGPDEPEPEEEDPTEPPLLNEPHDQGEEQPAQDEALHGADPVDDPEPGPSLEDTVANLEALVEHLREQLQMANDDSRRQYQQLQELLQEHERLAEQYGAAQRVAGDFYMDRQLVLHQMDQQRDLEVEIQNAVNQRINQLLNRHVFFTRGGECWHLSLACATARAHTPVFGRRACRVCVHALQVLQPEPDVWAPFDAGTTFRWAWLLWHEFQRGGPGRWISWNSTFSPFLLPMWNV